MFLYSTYLTCTDVYISLFIKCIFIDYRTPWLLLKHNLNTPFIMPSEEIKRNWGTGFQTIE